VDWFNAVDATYRADLRELNDLNFGRFDARLEQRVAGLEAKMEQRLAEVAARLERRLGDIRVELLRWMFVFWAGTVVPLAALIVALNRL
jgi:hypothetical protein